MAESTTLTPDQARLFAAMQARGCGPTEMRRALGIGADAFSRLRRRLAPETIDPKRQARGRASHRSARNAPVPRPQRCLGHSELSADGRCTKMLPKDPRERLCEHCRGRS